jgi:hypothetical protein
MNKEFVPYDIALELQNIGFNEPCFGLYSYPSKTVFLHHYGVLETKEQVLAPLYQQVFKFFRDVYKLKGDVTHASQNGKYKYTIWKWNFDNHIGKHERIGVINSWFKHEDASLECIRHLIDIVKTNKLIPNYRTDEDLEMEELRKKVRETYKL